MKAVFTFAGLLLASALFSQTSFRTAIKTANSNDDNELFKVIQLSDGSYLGVGTKGISSNHPSIMVVKLNTAGSVTSSEVITNTDFTEDDGGVGIIATTDGGYAISGTLDDQMTIIKLDANLNQVWQKGYTLAGDIIERSRLVQTSDGGYMIVGAVYNSDDSSAAYLVKTDAQGIVSFSKQYSGFTSNLIFDIKPTKDGNYIMVSGNDDENFNDTTILTKIKPDGSVLWSRYIKTDTLGNISFSVLPSSDGGYVIAGSVAHIFTEIFSFGGFSDTVTVPLPQIMMSKFDASGNLAWSKKINSPDIPIGLLYSATEDKDGGYIFSGLYETIDTSFLTATDTAYSYLVKLSSGGNLVWTRGYNQSSDQNGNTPIFTELSRTSDGGLIVAGSGYQASDSDFSQRGVAYKFDNNDQVCGNVSSAGSLENAGTGNTFSMTSISLATTETTFTVTTTGNVSSYDLCNILPVKLLSFNATLQNKSVNIEWTTANEINADHFTVERSSNGISFSAMQTVSAKGNSSNVQTYAVNDLQPLFGTSYYRLQQVDKDGKTTYSNTVPVIVSANGTIVISPNPVRNDIHVLMQSAASSNATFSITDMAGKLLMTKAVVITEGANTITVPAAAFSKGLYILTVKDGHSTQSMKFVKE